MSKRKRPGFEKKAMTGKMIIRGGPIVSSPVARGGRGAGLDSPFMLPSWKKKFESLDRT